MSAIEELKTLIEKDQKLTAELQAKFDNLSDDYVAQAEYKKLQADVAANAEARAKAEEELKATQAAVEDLKALAEEAAMKANRRGGGGSDVDEAQAEHKEAFIGFLRNRDDYDAQRSLKEAEKKAVQTTVSGDGGYAVPEVISRDIQSKVEDIAIMRGLVKTVTVGTSDYRELVDKGGMAFGWVGETGARTETGTPGLYEVIPSQGTIYAYPKATEESLDDVFFNVEMWLAEAARVAFANGIDAAIVSGDGTNKPLGMLGAAPLATADGSRTDGVYQYLATGVAGDFGADAHKDIIDMIYTLKAKYRPSASWIMNSLTTAAVRVLKDGNGRPLWQDNQILGEPPMLEGYAVNPVENMPDIGADALPIGFGDYRAGYTLVERHMMRITRDEYTQPGYVKWHLRRRVGGAPTNDDAVKFLKMSLT